MSAGRRAVEEIKLSKMVRKWGVCCRRIRFLVDAVLDISYNGTGLMAVKAVRRNGMRDYLSGIKIEKRKMNIFAASCIALAALVVSSSF